MSFDKARNQKATLYILVVSFFSLLLFVTYGSLRQVMLTIQIVLFSLPCFYLIYKTKNIIPSLISMGYAIFFCALFALVFRKLRDSLPPPEIHSNKIIGYSQYFGYPFFMDTIIFMLFFFFPLVIFFFLGLRKKKHKLS